MSFQYKARTGGAGYNGSGHDKEEVKERPGGKGLARGSSNNATYFGFIAQDVEGRYPELVGRGSDGMRSVQYSAFVPLIIEGMKGQKRETNCATKH